jgi:hypothetical protein
MVFSLVCFLLKFSGSHPVSKYNDSPDANSDKPVTILAAISWSFSYFSASVWLHPPTSNAYSNIGLTNAVYINDNVFRLSLNFSLNPFFFLALNSIESI